MKRSSGRDFLVAEASNASPDRTLWDDQVSCPVIEMKTTGKMSLGPTAKIAVLRRISR